MAYFIEAAATHEDEDMPCKSAGLVLVKCRYFLESSHGLYGKCRGESDASFQLARQVQDAEG